MTRNEARYLVWKHYDVRADHRVSVRHLEDLLLYKRKTTPVNRVNEMRGKLIDFVAKHRGQLSLYCDGNCFNHMDAVVLNCFAQLIDAEEDNLKSATKEIDGSAE